MEPNDMAPVAKRLTISLAGSTSSSGMGCSAVLISSRPRSVQSWRLRASMSCVYSSNVREAFALDGVLQLGDGIGVVQVIFAVGAELVVAADGEFGDGFAHGSERVAMLLDGFFGEDIEIDAADAGDRAGEVTIDEIFIESDGFEDLGAR